MKLDPLSEYGARSLAEAIRHYWAFRGYIVKVWIERSDPKTHQVPYFVIRSDMKGGKPA